MLGSPHELRFTRGLPRVGSEDRCGHDQAIFRPRDSGLNDPSAREVELFFDRRTLRRGARRLPARSGLARAAHARSPRARLRRRVTRPATVGLRRAMVSAAPAAATARLGLRTVKPGRSGLSLAPSPPADASRGAGPSAPPAGPRSGRSPLGCSARARESRVSARPAESRVCSIGRPAAASSYPSSAGFSIPIARSSSKATGAPRAARRRSTTCAWSWSRSSIAPS
jgi:hypothetical protein